MHFKFLDLALSKRTALPLESGQKCLSRTCLFKEAFTLFQVQLKKCCECGGGVLS